MEISIDEFIEVIDNIFLRKSNREKELEDSIKEKDNQIATMQVIIGHLKGDK